MAAYAVFFDWLDRLDRLDWLDRLDRLDWLDRFDWLDRLDYIVCGITAYDTFHHSYHISVLGYDTFVLVNNFANVIDYAFLNVIHFAILFLDCRTLRPTTRIIYAYPYTPNG